MTHSLRNRLAFVFFAITLVAIAALYLYVAPGLRARLINERMRELATAAHQDSFQIVPAIRPGSRDSVNVVRSKVDAAGLASGDRVTLLLVTRTASGVQLSVQADSTKLGAAAALPYKPAYRAAQTGRATTGTERSTSGTVAEAAVPVVNDDRVTDVIVYSSPVSDIVHSVSIVRQQILIAGGIALLLALVGGYLVARALAQRVKRLELAVEEVAAGRFERQIPVDSNDEPRQLARAFKPHP